MCVDACRALDVELDVSLHEAIWTMTCAPNFVVFVCTCEQLCHFQQLEMLVECTSWCCLKSMMALLMEMSSTFLVHMDAGLSDESLLPGKVSDMCCTFLLWWNCLAIWKRMMSHTSTAFVSYPIFVHPCGISAWATKSQYIHGGRWQMLPLGDRLSFVYQLVYLQKVYPVERQEYWYVRSTGISWHNNWDERYRLDNQHVTNGVGSFQHSLTIQASGDGQCHDLGSQICKTYVRMFLGAAMVL